MALRLTFGVLPWTLEDTDLRWHVSCQSPSDKLSLWSRIFLYFVCALILGSLLQVSSTSRSNILARTIYMSVRDVAQLTTKKGTRDVAFFSFFFAEKKCNPPRCAHKPCTYNVPQGWDPSKHSTARTPLPFSVSFSLFPFFVFFPLLFGDLRVPFLVPFSFVVVLSSCRFPFDSCIAFFAFTFASLLSLVTDSVLLLFYLGATPPPHSLPVWSMRIPLACCLLSSFLRCWCWLIFIFFFSSFPFSISIWTSFVFILSCSCGYYAVSSVSVSAATRLAYDIPGTSYVAWYVYTYADLTFLFLSEVLRSIRFVSVIVYYLPFLLVFLLR